jgi:hypothetical protein
MYLSFTKILNLLLNKVLCKENLIKFGLLEILNYIKWISVAKVLLTLNVREEILQ